jgi:FtsP/CotA-like multicopper oxidase with cupredoxin domain
MKRKSIILVVLLAALGAADSFAFVPGGTLDPTTIPQFKDPLVIPPVMPAKDVKFDKSAGKLVPYYEIEVVQFDQQILPAKDINGKPLSPTTVWSYGAVGRPETRNYPAWTIENLKNLPTRVKWVNNLKDPKTGHFLPHLLAIDQTLHWANPPQDCIDLDMGTMTMNMKMADCRGQSQAPYRGPVPIVTHLHGSHVQPDSDGYPEAWYLPAAKDIPHGYATEGTLYDDIFGGSGRGKGFAVYQYRNDQRSTTLWYHDHALGMTRANVYAGPAGFFMIRDLKDLLLGLPGPAPLPGIDPNNDPKARKLIREIPIVIQDKAFNVDENGQTSLFYPNNRAFFEGLNAPTLPVQFPGAGDLIIPFIPDFSAFGNGRSDVSPLWNPEFFGNTMVVNGKTWPFLNVEQSRYRLRFLNGSDSRFLILKNDNNLPFWQIGADGGFLPAPAQLDTLLMGPAERADVIVDFSNVPVGTEITLLNLGPDEPFGGGVPGVDFVSADPATTGKVMKFIVGKRTVTDLSKPAANLRLPALPRLGAANNVRRLSLNEDMSMTICVEENAGNIIEAPCAPDMSNAFGPTSARLGILGDDGIPVPKSWMEAITENPKLGDTEIWEIYNFTADAHPIHLHLVQFEVIDRQDLVTDDEGISAPPARLSGDPRPPEAWETGTKDTLIVYPGTVARVKAKYDLAGLFVWHCHILSHEDNEMMRPYTVVK